ncbi:MAG: hypothetical protein IJV35_01540 [Neisseriaceae bacterium]|nr:hypothetical protein [Neisseriaceae bacterium]
MKNTFILIIMLLTLTACSSEDRVNFVLKIMGKGNVKYLPPDTPLPEKPKITLNFLTNEEIADKVAENNQYIENKIIQKDSSTIYYFIKEKDKNNKTIYSLTNDKQTAQFYRVVLGKTAENYCVVQDFYINDKKKTEKHIILDTDCTKHLSTNSNVSSRKNKNFSTFIVYEPQDKISVIDNLDRKNKIRNMYFYKDGKEDIIIHYDFNSNQQLVLFFDMNRENPDIYIRKFNDKQIIYEAQFGDFYPTIKKNGDYVFDEDAYKKQKSITKVREWKDINNNGKSTYTKWYMYKDDNKMTVLQRKNEEFNDFKYKYKNFINSKKMIDRP